MCWTFTFSFSQENAFIAVNHAGRCSVLFLLYQFKKLCNSTCSTWRKNNSAQPYISFFLSVHAANLGYAGSLALQTQWAGCRSAWHSRAGFLPRTGVDGYLNDPPSALPTSLPTCRAQNSHFKQGRGKCELQIFSNLKNLCCFNKEAKAIALQQTNKTNKRTKASHKISSKVLKQMKSPE